MRWLLLLLPVVFACGESLPEVNCTDGAAVPAYSEVTGLNTCRACHASNLTGGARNDAPDDINFDTYEASKLEAESAASQTFGGSMPPAGYTMTEEQKQGLYRWALCGTPQ